MSIREFKSMQEVVEYYAIEAFNELYDANIESIKVEETRKEFEGDYTINVFPYLKISGKSPEATATEIGENLSKILNLLSSFNVQKGFLNLSLHSSKWIDYLQNLITEEGKDLNFTDFADNIVLEYCGPNTNKPLHLGHIRNMLLGYSLSEILKTAGNTLHKVNIYNDRGIAICKSMLAWKIYGKGETPASTNTKGDHFVGKYYVLFDKVYQEQITELKQKDFSQEEAERQAPIFIEAQEMLRQWEAGNTEIIQIWQTMNQWVYSGFEETFKSLGVDFDKAYKESDYYLFGKDLVLQGLKEGKFIQKGDSSVWVDLTNDGLDEKILLRSDGTSVYLTQDLGVAEKRYEDYHMNRSLYVVGSEQDYHFKVLKLTLQKLGLSFADGVEHVSYGMVDLPDGKMKSREGTVVDADDLIAEMIAEAKRQTEELGKVEMMSEEELQQLYRTIGLGALKFFILRVNPKKRILFNPKESIDFQGFTGPFVQYTHARICAILRKHGNAEPFSISNYSLNEHEIYLLKEQMNFKNAVIKAAQNLDPSEIANYAFSLAKQYNKFYSECSVLKAETKELVNLRVHLSAITAQRLKKCLELLGIDAPERM